MPVYSEQEIINSPPYYKFFTDTQPINFYNSDTACENEFEWLETCADSSTFVLMPEVQGAINIEHCTDVIC